MNIFSHQFRVRYAETDQMGVTYYANYLVWFEMGRAEYLRASGISYPDYEKAGIFLPVVESYARYLGSSAYDDELCIQVVVSEIRHCSIRFEYCILKAGTCITRGYTVHLFINREKKTVPVPAEIKEKIPIQTLE